MTNQFVRDIVDCKSELLECDAHIIKAMESLKSEASEDVFTALQQSRREITQLLGRINYLEGKARS